MTPVALYVLRPYETVEEYLEAEAWTIDARAILLLDQEKLEPDTPVVFDLCLTNGARILRAEGRVAASAGDGLKVRYRRYSSQAKAFIERAIQAREDQLAREAQKPSSAPPAENTTENTLERAPEPAPAPAAVSPAAEQSSAHTPPAAAASPPPAPVPAAPPPVRSEAPPAPSASATDSPPSPNAARYDSRSWLYERSGIRVRQASEVIAPPNRDALLDRLRKRKTS